MLLLRNCLEKQRAIFEAYEVFPAAMIDGILKQLRGMQDRTLRADIINKPEEVAALVKKYFHCG